MVNVNFRLRSIYGDVRDNISWYLVIRWESRSYIHKILSFVFWEQFLGLQSKLTKVSQKSSKLTIIHEHVTKNYLHKRFKLNYLSTGGIFLDETRLINVHYQKLTQSPTYHASHDFSPTLTWTWDWILLTVLVMFLKIKRV